jgi:Sucrase/ferredoxin-like
VPHGRLLFIRRPDRRGRPELAAFAACSREGEERLVGIEFQRHDELRGLDLLRDAPTLDHPLLIVCTHGKHDPCCARYGRPLYEALRDELDERWVWQSSHLGGDRFAGNLICLPEGLYFGRVERGQAPHVLDEYLSGRIELDHYRGRSCQTFPVQAADRAVRLARGLPGVHDLRFQHIERAGGGWRVELATATGTVHVAEAEAELGDRTLLTCNAEVARRPRRYSATAVS